MIWKRMPSREQLAELASNNMVAHLGIECVAFGDDYIEATMPVDHRTVQPFRILHGGASVALAETLGSLASAFCLADPTRETAVGVEINANHLRPVREGNTVTGCVTPIKIGRRMHVWQIEIRNADQQLVCVSRLTIAIVPRTA